MTHADRCRSSVPMRRREVLTLLAAAGAWPLAARAQHSERMRRIGVLIARSDNDPEGQKQAAAFERGLRELGWTPGHDTRIDYRWQTNNPAQRAAFVDELIALKPDILVVNSTPYLAVVRDAARTIPVVFVAIA